MGEMLYKNINYFLEVANCLSFTEAAKHKCITQQAMTRNIAYLEQDLGVKLFVRSTRSVNLTDAGKMLRDDFTRIDEEIRTSVERVKGLAVNDAAVLSIGFFQGLSSTSIIMPLISYLREKYPDISFDVSLSDMAAMRNYLIDGQLDLCITTASDWSIWPDVEISILKSYPFEVILSKNHALANNASLELEDLKNEILFAIPPASMERKAPYWQDHIPRQKKVTLPNLENVLINVEIGRGFACLVKVFEDADSGKFKTYPLPFADAHAELLCARRKNPDNTLVLSVMRSIQHFFMRK